MATAYFATTWSDTQIFIPGIIGAFVRPFSFNIANTTNAAGFVVNDTVALAPLPHLSGAGGVMVLGYQVEIPSLDTGTSVVTELGDNNGTSGAFQATYFTTTSNTIGQNGAGVYSPVMGFAGTTAVAPVRGAIPRSYTTSTVTSSSTPYTSLNFILKVTTAPHTATTTGLITGYLLLQPMATQSVTYLNGASN